MEPWAGKEASDWVHVRSPGLSRTPEAPLLPPPACTAPLLPFRLVSKQYSAALFLYCAQAEAVDNRGLASRGEEATKEHWKPPAVPGAHDPRGMKSWVACAIPHSYSTPSLLAHAP